MAISITVVGIHHCYQYARSIKPSSLEDDQRKKFIERVRELIDEVAPNVVADESLDSNNSALFACYPPTALSIRVDIPKDARTRRKLWIGRKGEELCPYLDSLRERFWKWRIFQACRPVSAAQVFMFCGSNHLYRSTEKPKSFPDLLRQAHYSVSVVDLRIEQWWDESWTGTWVDPDPQPGYGVSPCCMALGTYDGKCLLKQ